MINKAILPLLLLILSGCYIINLAAYNTSRDENDTAFVLIPHYSPVYYGTPILLDWHYKETEYPFEIQIDIADSFPDAIILWDSIIGTHYDSLEEKGLDPFLDPNEHPIVTIYWRVRLDKVESDNFIDTVTPWSEASSFVLMNRKLPVFIPHENPTHTKTPTLSWHPHPDSSSGSCILKVNTDSSNLFNDKDHLFELPLGHPDDTSYTFTDDTLPTGTIYWKLEYDKSISSAIQSLTIVPDKKPIPIPFEVANRNRPSFSWKKTSDTESFTFELDDDMNFLSPIISTPVYSTFFVPYIDISGINKNYYWRVRSNKTRIWSETYKFKIDTVPLLHKFNGELHNDPRPTFQWDVAQSTSKYEYRIQIADNKRFKPNHIEKDIAAGSSFTPANNLPANKLLKKQKYFWRIGYSLQGQDNFTFTECDSITIDYTITAAGQLSGKQISPTHFFSSQKLISFSINNQKDRILGLYIYDLKGRNIHSVSLNNMDKNSIEWDYSLGNGRMVPSGMYLIKIISEKKIFNFKTLYCNQ